MFVKYVSTGLWINIYDKHICLSAKPLKLLPCWWEHEQQRSKFALLHSFLSSLKQLQAEITAKQALYKIPDLPQCETGWRPTPPLLPPPCSSAQTSHPGVTTCASHSLATTGAPLFASARFVVLSRLQEMQHYICLQPTGTRTRSCYVIKECYPERVCVWLNPLGLATIAGFQANQNGERKLLCVCVSLFKTFNIPATGSNTQPKYEFVAVSIYTMHLVCLWAHVCDFVWLS